MKKLLALLLAVVLILSFAACGSDTSGGGNSNGDLQKPGELNLTHGKVENGVYKNRLLGLEVQIPDSWKYSSDKELAALCGVDEDDMQGDNFKKNVEAYGSMLDFVGGTENSDVGMNVTVISLADYPLITNASGLTVAQFAEKYISTFEGTTEMSTKTVKLGGDDYYSATVVLVEAGLLKTYYFRGLGGYITMIDVTYGGNVTIESIEAMFK